MASAMETENYYCHSCDERILPVTEEKLCPNCMSGFVEEMFGNDSDPADPDAVEEYERGIPQQASIPAMTGQDMLTIFNSFMGQLANLPQGPEHFPPQHDSVASDAVPHFADPAPSVGVNDNPNPPPISLSGATNQRRASLQRHQTRTFIDDVFRNALGVDQPANFPFGPGLLPQWNFMELHGNTGDYAWGPSGLDDIISQLLGQLDNAGPPPASEQTISGLPKIVVDQALVDSGKDCSVCMETFNVGDEVKKLPCTHFFHIPCIEPWLKLHNTCPICRKLVEDPSCGRPSSSSPTVSAASGSTGGASTSFNMFYMPHGSGGGHEDDHTYAE